VRPQLLEVVHEAEVAASLPLSRSIQAHCACVIILVIICNLLVCQCRLVQQLSLDYTTHVFACCRVLSAGTKQSTHMRFPFCQLNSGPAVLCAMQVLWKHHICSLRCCRPRCHPHGHRQARRSNARPCNWRSAVEA
jgi:hypothetical protein